MNYVLLLGESMQSLGAQQRVGGGFGQQSGGADRCGAGNGLGVANALSRNTGTKVTRLVGPAWSILSVIQAC